MSTTTFSDIPACVLAPFLSYSDQLVLRGVHPAFPAPPPPLVTPEHTAMHQRRKRELAATSSQMRPHVMEKHRMEDAMNQYLQACEDGSMGMLRMLLPTLQHLRPLYHMYEHMIQKGKEDAAGNGHLDVLVYLMRTFSWPQLQGKDYRNIYIINAAARGGQLHVVQYMYHHINNHNSSLSATAAPVPQSAVTHVRTAMEHAADCGQVHVLRWLMHNARWSRRDMNGVIESAARHGQLPVLQMLRLEDRVRKYHTGDLSRAIRSDDVPTVQYLLAHVGKDLLRGAPEHAARWGSRTILSWMWQHHRALVNLEEVMAVKSLNNTARAWACERLRAGAS